MTSLYVRKIQAYFYPLYLIITFGSVWVAITFYTHPLFKDWPSFEFSLLSEVPISSALLGLFLFSCIIIAMLTMTPVYFFLNQSMVSNKKLSIFEFLTQDRLGNVIKYEVGGLLRVQVYLLFLSVSLLIFFLFDRFVGERQAPVLIGIILIIYIIHCVIEIISLNTLKNKN